MKDYTTIRMWKTSLKGLRMIYAITGERMVSILDRLIAIELERVMEGKRRNDNSNTKER